MAADEIAHISVSGRFVALLAVPVPPAPLPEQCHPQRIEVGWKIARSVPVLFNWLPDQRNGVHSPEEVVGMKRRAKFKYLIHGGG